MLLEQIQLIILDTTEHFFVVIYHLHKFFKHERDNLSSLRQRLGFLKQNYPFQTIFKSPPRKRLSSDLKRKTSLKIIRTLNYAGIDSYP